jgi:5-methylcytosine-specific restriction endonuclease McrA
MSYPSILALDCAGTPHRWINVEETIHYYATDCVAWAVGTNEFVFRGGVQRRTGRVSEIRANSIIALKGKDFITRNYDRVPAVTKDMLLVRDRFICAYCGEKFRERDLEIEHIIPQSRGGKNTWMNLVAACRCCNHRKDDRTPEEAGMELLYLPYVPNRHEAFILSGKKILADQMEFLLMGVPKHSRLKPAA